MSLATLESLISASSSSFFEPLGIACSFANEVGSKPGVIAQPPDLCGRNERGAEHSSLIELGKPDRVVLVGLRPTRNLFDITRVDKPHRQSASLEQVHEWTPVVGGRLNDDAFDSLADEAIGKVDDRVGRRDNAPNLRDSTTRYRRVRNTGVHLPCRLGNIDRRHPLDDLLVLVRVDLDRLATHWTPPNARKDVRAARGLGREPEI